MRLTEKIIEERIMTEASGWTFRDNSLYREFAFKDFVEAFTFMIKVAEVAERHKHHPNWTNVYNSVTIQLSTHSSDGVTDKDFKLAKEINSVV